MADRRSRSSSPILFNFSPLFRCTNVFIRAVREALILDEGHKLFS